MIRSLPGHCPLLYCSLSTKNSERQCTARTVHSRSLMVRASSSSSSEVSLTPTPPTSKSIITQENIINALTGDGIMLEDHYARLRVEQQDSSAEIFNAYRERCNEVRQQGLEESEAREQLGRLQDSMDLLTSEEERRLYDWSLLRKATHSVDYAWPFEADISQRLPDSPPLSTPPEETEGNRKVALFFGGWFVLSCILSIAFNVLQRQSQLNPQ